MNKYQEALSSIRFSFGMRAKPKYVYESEKENFDILEELVEKSTPKKVRRALHIANGYKHCCPICSSYVGTISKVGRIDEDDYCPTCGQALDWREEE